MASITKTFSLSLVTTPTFGPGYPLPTYPTVKQLTLSYDAAIHELRLVISGEEANVDAAAEILLAHFTPNVVVRAWHSIVTWWNS